MLRFRAPPAAGGELVRTENASTAQNAGSTGQADPESARGVTALFCSRAKPSRSTWAWLRSTLRATSAYKRGIITGFAMRRAVSSTLLLLLVAPLGLLALRTTQRDLPACCRAGGAHHCTAMLQPFTGADRVIAQRERCPYAHPAVLPHPARTQNSHIPMAGEAHPFLQEFVPGIRGTAKDDSHADRGPPMASR